MDAEVPVEIETDSARSQPTQGSTEGSTRGSNTPSQYIEPDSFPTSGEEDEDGFMESDLYMPKYANERHNSSTKSLTNSAWTFTKENGRTYHGYKAGSYPFPNDSTEIERLDFQYALISHVFGDKLYFAPISNPSNILDIGTGTGAWATDMGDAFPSAIVEGTDLSPIQPTAVPDNVHFLIDDAEQDDWAVPPNHYDFIHTRIMLGCFHDFRTILTQAHKHLKPGGWMECQEVMSTPYCDDGTMPPDWPFKEWTNSVDDASMRLERPLRIANKLKRWFAEAGYVDIHEKVFKLPVNSWPRDPELKTLGTWWQHNLLVGLQGFSLAYFTRVLGWTKDEIEVHLVNVRNGLKNRHIHAYHKLYVVYGRKPETASGSSKNINNLQPSKIAQFRGPSGHKITD